MLGVEAFGGWLGHEARAFIIDIGAYIKEISES